MNANQVELLAPAKDLDCGIAAINCGADAVYIGAARFGAREHAGNALEEIAALVRYAHKYWAQVYVTLNTLLRDDEIPHAVRLAEQVYELGADGLIIQDVGLLECALPPIPLIASTQMHNATPEKVAFLEQVGFQRAILARELSLEQIAEIKRQTSIELECFIHGSLCVCYSGQCYLSYALGGRSGNRGQCAQPCRKRYALLDAAGVALAGPRHWLSLRDLNLTAHLGDLLEAGVSSFKIEGRLKDKAYVMNVVSHYRAQLDAALENRGMRKSSSGAAAVDFTPDPEKTFNRGYTRYFLRGPGEPVASPDTPKMVGERVGTVTAMSPRGFTLDAGVELHNGDGICFFDFDGELRGTVVNRVNGADITPERMEGIAVGGTLFRNHDHAFLTRLTKGQAERRIAVTFTLRATAAGFELTATDEDGNQAVVPLAGEKVLAERPERAAAAVEAQLRKTGDTEFACAGVGIEWPVAYYLPLSALNTLRRDVLEKLTGVRAASRPRHTGGVQQNAVLYPERTLSYLGNVLNRKAADFYRRHGVTRIDVAAETGVDLRGRQVMRTKHCLRRELGRCRHGQAAPLYLVDNEGHRLELRFDCARCEMGIFLK